MTITVPAHRYVIDALNSLNSAARPNGIASATICGFPVVIKYRIPKGKVDPVRFCTANGTRISYDKLHRICVLALGGIDDAALVELIANDLAATQNSAVKHLADLAAARKAAADKDARDTEYFEATRRGFAILDRLAPPCRFELGDDEIANDPAIAEARRRYAATMKDMIAAEVEAERYEQLVAAK